MTRNAELVAPRTSATKKMVVVCLLLSNSGSLIEMTAAPEAVSHEYPRLHSGILA